MINEEWELKTGNQKWADFIITAIKEDHGVIIAVKLGIDDGEHKIRDIKEFSKAVVIKLLNDGEEIFTAYKKGGVFYKGESVKAYDFEHFRTKSNDKAFDNLDKLERF